MLGWVHLRYAENINDGVKAFKLQYYVIYYFVSKRLIPLVIPFKNVFTRSIENLRICGSRIKGLIRSNENVLARHQYVRK